LLVEIVELDQRGAGGAVAARCPRRGTCLPGPGRSGDCPLMCISRALAHAGPRKPRWVPPLSAGLVEVAFRTGGLALNSDPGTGMTRAPVFRGQSVARSGHLDRRRQVELPNLLRSDTPTQLALVDVPLLMWSTT
jgi:hypothetical protein